MTTVTGPTSNTKYKRYIACACGRKWLCLECYRATVKRRQTTTREKLATFFNPAIHEAVLVTLKVEQANVSCAGKVLQALAGAVTEVGRMRVKEMKTGGALSRIEYAVAYPHFFRDVKTDGSSEVQKREFVFHPHYHMLLVFDRGYGRLVRDAVQNGFEIADQDIMVHWQNDGENDSPEVIADYLTKERDIHNMPAKWPTDEPMKIKPRFRLVRVWKRPKAKQSIDAKAYWATVADRMTKDTRPVPQAITGLRRSPIAIKRLGQLWRAIEALWSVASSERRRYIELPLREVAKLLECGITAVRIDIDKLATSGVLGRIDSRRNGATARYFYHAKKANPKENRRSKGPTNRTACIGRRGRD